MTPRKAEILVTLSVKVRVLADRQIAPAWWRPTGSGLRAARDTLAELVADGFLERHQVHGQLLDVTTPVFSWEVNDPAPDFTALSTRLQRRWCDSPTGGATEPLTVFVATARTLRQFGGRGRGGLHQPTAINHDLLLGSAYQWHRTHRPEHALAWQGEDTYADQLAASGEKRPDAILFAPDGTAERVIESGGAYSAERCREFHESCVARQIPYDLW